MSCHRTRTRPLFGDVDAMNVVYYGNYLRFFELGRCELMRAGGGTYAQLQDQGYHLPVTEAHLRYRRPARYDQEITIETTVAWVKKASCRFDYRVLEDRDGEEPLLLVSGYTSHGCVDRAGRVRPLPGWVIQILESYAGK